jgi:hypothetical protein
MCLHKHVCMIKMNAEGMSQALQALDAAINAAINDKDASKLASKALREQKLEMLRKLGWSHWASLQASVIAQACPDDFPLL